MDPGTISGYGSCHDASASVRLVSQVPGVLHTNTKYAIRYQVSTLLLIDVIMRKTSLRVSLNREILPRGLLSGARYFRVQSLPPSRFSSCGDASRYVLGVARPSWTRTGRSWISASIEIQRTWQSRAMTIQACDALKR